MNYYSHHIGDFNSGTKNFSRLERWLYRDMLEMYYDGEKPLIGDFDELCDELGAESNEEKSAVSRILRRKFVLVDGKYQHERCEHEISAYQRSVEKARENGKKGGRPAKSQTEPKAKETGEVIFANQTLTKPQANQEPITNNHNNSSSEQSPDKPKPKKWGTEEDHKAARWIFSMIRKLNKSAKEPSWNSWANDIRLMRENDKRSHHEICDLFKRANADIFWQSNILSPAKLREKWDSLAIKLGSAIPPEPVKIPRREVVL